MCNRLSDFTEEQNHPSQKKNLVTCRIMVAFAFTSDFVFVETTVYCLTLSVLVLGLL